MAKKTKGAAPRRRIKVKAVPERERTLTAKQSRRVKGGASETVQGTNASADSIWIDLGYPVRGSSKK